MDISVKVDVLAGCDISRAAQQACELATKIGVNVEFKFNDVTCVAQPNAEFTDMVGEWYLMLNNGRQYKMAFARSRK